MTIFGKMEKVMIFHLFSKLAAFTNAIEGKFKTKFIFLFS